MIILPPLTILLTLVLFTTITICLVVTAFTLAEILANIKSVKRQLREFLSKEILTYLENKTDSTIK